MKKVSLHVAFVGVAAAAVLAACHGAGNYVPSAMQQSENPLAGAPLPADIAKAAGISAFPDAIPQCTAKADPVPGTYYLFVSEGHVKGAVYTGDPNASIWEQLKVTKATPPPTTSPSPTTSPTTGPTPAPEYFYYGTYTLKQGGQGCAYLITTKSGKPFKGTTYNGEAIGSPKFKAKYVNEQFVATGPLTITIKNLSQSGGSGNFAFKNNSGKTIDTGTVKLIGRVLVK